MNPDSPIYKKLGETRKIKVDYSNFGEEIREEKTCFKYSKFLYVKVIKRISTLTSGMESGMVRLKKFTIHIIKIFG